MPQTEAGMFIDIAQRFNVDLAGVPSIGDSLRDLQAAAAAGAQPMLVLTGKGAKTRRAAGCPRARRFFADLAEAVRNIVA
jgi:D-glycero-D-manno-heptose 1,7-bisphosphate phosphatase